MARNGGVKKGSRTAPRCRSPLSVLGRQSASICEKCAQESALLAAQRCQQHSSHAASRAAKAAAASRLALDSCPPATPPAGRALHVCAFPPLSIATGPNATAPLNRPQAPLLLSFAPAPVAGVTFTTMLHTCLMRLSMRCCANHPIHAGGCVSRDQLDSSNFKADPGRQSSLLQRGSGAAFQLGIEGHCQQ